MKTFALRLHPKNLSRLLTALSLVLAMLFVSSCSRVTRAERAKIADMTQNFDGSDVARQRISDAYAEINVHGEVLLGIRGCIGSAKSKNDFEKCQILLEHQ